MKVYCEQVLASTEFLNILQKLKEYKVFLHGGLVKKGWTRNDIDIYVEGLNLSDTLYWQLPRKIRVDGISIPVSYTLLLTEPNIELCKGDAP